MVTPAAKRKAVAHLQVRSDGWGQEPIRIGDCVLATLIEAGEYIATLPKKEHAAPEWSTTTAALPPA